MPAMPITDQHTGPATIASYTVAHGRDGAPEWGLVIGDLADGTRTYGRVEDSEPARGDGGRPSGSAATVELATTDAGVNLVASDLTDAAQRSHRLASLSSHGRRRSRAAPVAARSPSDV